MLTLRKFVRTWKYVTKYNKPRKMFQLISLHLKILDNHLISGHWYYDTQATDYINIYHCVIMIVRPTTPTVHT